MKILLSLLISVFLIACNGFDMSSIASSSILTTSLSESASSSSLTSSSQSQVSSSSSENSTSSTSISTNTSSSENQTLNSIWSTPMGGISTSGHYQVNLTLNQALTEVDVRLAVAVYDNTNAYIGTAYEAVVDGNAGSNTIRFRVGFVDGKFAGMVMVSHQEHAGFGVIIINALRNQLPGQPANMDAVQAILIGANATRTGKSETYDGMIPAIEAMVLHYSTFIG